MEAVPKNVCLLNLQRTPCAKLTYIDFGHPGLLASSTASDYFHKEPINQVSWILEDDGLGASGGAVLNSGNKDQRGSLDSGYRLATVTSEGKVSDNVENRPGLKRCLLFLDLD